MDGATSYNAKAHTLEWRLDLISDSNASGTLEFNIPGRSADAFFPVTVDFMSTTTLCDIDVRVCVCVDVYVCGVCMDLCACVCLCVCVKARICACVRMW